MNDAATPYVTVVTVVKNNQNGLTQTIQSMLDQAFVNWEMLIILGESVDESQKIASQACASDPRIILHVQEDSGIYNAMNKGLKLARGEYIWFMNSGDVFASSQSLNTAYSSLTSMNIDALVGGYSFESDFRMYSFSKKPKILSPWEISLNRRGLCHQSTVYRTNALRVENGFNINYPLAADFDVALRICMHGQFRRINDVLSKIETGGVSHLQLERVLIEKQNIRTFLFGNNSFQVILGSIWTIAVKMKAYLRDPSPR